MIMSLFQVQGVMTSLFGLLFLSTLPNEKEFRTDFQLSLFMISELSLSASAATKTISSFLQDVEHTPWPNVMHLTSIKCKNNFAALL